MPDRCFAICGSTEKGAIPSRLFSFLLAPPKRVPIACESPGVGNRRWLCPNPVAQAACRFANRPQRRAGKTSRREMQLQTTRAMTTGNADSKHKKRIIAIHGKGDDGPAFERYLQPLVEATAKEGWEWVWPTAPHKVRDGYAWWLTPPGVRSFEAESWEGIEESIAVVDGLYPFDAMLGHSQGAMLAAVLAARSQAGLGPCSVPAILSGSAWPMPFDALLRDMDREGSNLPPSLHTIGAADNINPPVMAMEVAECFGSGASILNHMGGHHVPLEPDQLQKICDFLSATSGEQELL